jgi:toxin YhaV
VVEVHGWRLFGHPLFLAQVERLAAAVERAKVRDPVGYRQGANAKLLASLAVLVFDRIPRDPTHPDYRQGGTLGPNRRHWFRAKFGGERFRLFFRFRSRERVIVYAWVNDRDSLRASGARSDAYAVFRRMLEQGDPPDEWATLLAQARELGADDLEA